MTARLPASRRGGVQGSELSCLVAARLASRRRGVQELKAQQRRPDAARFLEEPRAAQPTRAYYVAAAVLLLCGRRGNHTPDGRSLVQTSSCPTKSPQHYFRAPAEDELALNEAGWDR